MRLVAETITAPPTALNRISTEYSGLCSVSRSNQL
jgi:hypothetical protein